MRAEPKRILRGIEWKENQLCFDSFHIFGNIQLHLHTFNAADPDGGGDALKWETLKNVVYVATM